MKELQQGEAKCMDCNHKWWVRAYEVPPGGMPQCPKCYGVGISTGRAKS